MTRRKLFLLVCTYLCSGCVPDIADLDAEVAAAIYNEGVQIMAAVEDGRIEHGGRIDQRHWPSGIAALTPESVVMWRDGLAINTGSFAREEWGYYVPRDALAFKEVVRDDSRFVLISGNLYKFHVGR